MSPDGIAKPIGEESLLPEDWSGRIDRIGAYYDDLVGRFGHDPRACDYGRAESQRIKFSVLAQAIPLAGKRVLDIGCGFADFADYLAAAAPEVRYTGVDISEAMIAEARGLRPHLDLRRLDILAPGAAQHLGSGFDLVTANGIFYLLGDEAETLMRRLIARMWSMCGEAVAVNSLSSWAEDREPGEFYADPARLLDFGRSLTPHVVLRHDYHPRDFTLYLYREPVTP